MSTFAERMKAFDPDAERKDAILRGIEDQISFVRMYGTKPISLTDLRRVYAILDAAIDTGVEPR